MSLPVSVVAKIQNVFPPRAAQYLPGAASGTVNLNWMFRGFGALQAYSVPLGTPVTAILLPPTGPRSQGNPARAQLTMTGSHDVVVFEL